MGRGRGGGGGELTVTSEKQQLIYLSSSDDLLGGVDRIPTPGTLLRTSIFLGKFRSVGVCCRPVRLSA